MCMQRRDCTLVMCRDCVECLNDWVCVRVATRANTIHSCANAFIQRQNRAQFVFVLLLLWKFGIFKIVALKCNVNVPNAKPYSNYGFDRMKLLSQKLRIIILFRRLLNNVDNSLCHKCCGEAGLRCACARVNGFVNCFCVYRRR